MDLPRFPGGMTIWDRVGECDRCCPSCVGERGGSVPGDRSPNRNLSVRSRSSAERTRPPPLRRFPAPTRSRWLPRSGRPSALGCCQAASPSCVHCSTRLGIARAATSDSRAISSGEWPACTSSTIWWRNSGANGRPDLDMVDFSNANAAAYESGQLHSGS